MNRVNSLFLINILSGIGFSIILPLFPPFGLKNGLPESSIGCLIGIFSLSRIFISPFTSLLIKKFSRFKLLYFATFVEATSTLLYGIISLLNSLYGFLFSMFIIRIMHGCCCGIINSLIFSLTISFSDPLEVQNDLADLELGWCIGITAGPIFASIFYKIGGYYLPFLILGSFLYLSVILSTKIDKGTIEKYEEIRGNHPFLKFFTYKEIIIAIGLFFSGYISQAFFYPSLTNYLEKNFGLSVSISSLFFTIIAISSAIASKYLDYFTTKYGLYGTALFGLLIVLFGGLMIYPLPPIPNNVFFVIIGLILVGGGEVLIVNPGLFFISIGIKNIDNDLDELTVNDITSSIHYFTNNISDFFGPIIGGLLSSYFGFKNCCIIISFEILFYCIFYLIYFHKYILEDLKKHNNVIIEKKTEKLN